MNARTHYKSENKILKQIKHNNIYICNRVKFSKHLWLTVYWETIEINAVVEYLDHQFCSIKQLSQVYSMLLF